MRPRIWFSRGWWICAHTKNSGMSGLGLDPSEAFKVWKRKRDEQVEAGVRAYERAMQG